MWEPTLFFSSPPDSMAWALSCFLHFPLLLSFILFSYMGIFLFLSGVWHLLLVFSWCAMRIVPFVDVFLICCGEKWTLIPPTPLLSYVSLQEFFKVSSCMLPGEFHGQRRLVGYRPWSHKVSDIAEQLTLSLWFLQCPLFSSILFSLQVFVSLQILFFL